MAINIVLLQLTFFVANGVNGHLGPIRVISGDDGPRTNTTTTDTVVGIILALERSVSWLSEGVMVVATSSVWPDDDDPPRRLLRALQSNGQEQPVYSVDVDHLLANVHHGTATADTVDAAGRLLPAVCARPANSMHYDTTSLLPPRSRYVVLFRDGPGPWTAHDSFAKLVSLNRTFWDTDVYYVIVARQFDPTTRHIVYTAWRDLSIYKVIVVTPTTIKLLDPFVRHTIDGQFTSIPLWSLKRIPEILQSRIKNLHRLPFRIVINKRIPTVVPTEGGVYIGQDGAFADVLAAKMNATPVYISDPSPSGRITYGYKRKGNKTYGTFAGVVDGFADISVNGHFLKDYNCYPAELTRHITSDKVCLLSPKAGVIPPMMTVLMSFQREVWMMTVITCIIVTVIYYVATAIDSRRPRPTGCNLGLEIYRMFIGAPTDKIFAYSCQRILTAFCLIFTLVILNAFQGSLVTFLSTPMHYPDINTFKDLEESELPIRTSSISFKEILISDPNLKSLANRVEKWANEIDIYNSDGRFAGFERVNVFNLEHFKDVLFVANENNTRVLHTMNECLMSYFISYVVHRDSPYKRRINILLSWIDQAGLVLKWNGDVSKYIFDKYKPINPKDYDTSKVFSVRDLEIAFIVLSFGIILSITVFFIEIWIYKYFKQPVPHFPFLH